MYDDDEYQKVYFDRINYRRKYELAEELLQHIHYLINEKCGSDELFDTVDIRLDHDTIGEIKYVLSM